MTIRPDINMPERAPELRGHHPLVAHFNDGYNTALDEVARLNPADPDDPDAPDLTGEVELPAYVERLLSVTQKMERVLEQADSEVERLTAENKALRNQADAHEAEIERLTAERDAAERDWLEDVERLTAENNKLRKQIFSASTFTSDPDAPPIPCVEVVKTERDGKLVRTWRAMGENVRGLGDEWECSPLGYSDWGEVPSLPYAESVYLIRRTAPEPAPVVTAMWST